MKATFKTTLVATFLLSTSAFVSTPTPANALFGVTCVPRLQNCWCTYLVPCPVRENQLRGLESVQSGLIDEAKDNGQEIAKQYTRLGSSLGCNNVSGSTPGVNALGIDINSILNSQLSNLNLGNLSSQGLSALQSQLADVGINPNMLQSVLDGNLDPADFLDMAESLGVDVPDLADMGISLSTLEDLANGNIDSLMAAGMDRIETELSNLGVNPDLLQDLMGGTLTTEQFLSQVGVSIPELNRLGLDLDTLNGLATGDISGLGQPSLDAILSKAMPKIDISAGTLQDMLAGIENGGINPSQLLDMAEASGLGSMSLQSLGVSSDTLTSLANGSMNPQQLLEISDALNIQEAGLGALGINEDLLTNIANGQLDPSSIMNIANGAGLTMPDLQGLGLDPSSLTNMVSEGVPGLMSTLQGAGLGNPIIDSLGIDAGMLGQIASGELDPSQITSMLAGTGLDPNSLVIPGMDGPITALTDTLSDPSSVMEQFDLNLAQMGTDPTQMLNISMGSIPGLSGAIGQDCGSGARMNNQIGGGLAGDSGSGVTGSADGGSTGAPGPTETAAPEAGGGQGTGGGGDTGAPGSLAGTGLGSGSVCGPERPMISSREKPHLLNPDLEGLDFALAGEGDIFLQEEAIADAASERSYINATAIARAITMRHLFVEALDGVKSMEETHKEISTNPDATPEEAQALNNAVQTHLVTLNAELVSFKTFLLTKYAADKLDPGLFTPVPIFPHNSEFEALMEETVLQQSQDLIDESERAEAAMQDYSDFMHQARMAYNSHNRVRNLMLMEQAVQEAAVVVDQHEDQKANVLYMENQIKSRLAQLYTNPERAWEILEQDMKANAGDLDDNRRWENAAVRSQALSNMLTAQTATTRYGDRIMVQPATREDPPQYSTISPMPYSYGEINTRQLEGYPMEPVMPMMGRGGEDGDSQPLPAMDGGIQNYMAMERREQAWSEIRRGGGGDQTMTGAFWNEMLDHSPSCLSGPLPTTGQNLSRRPEMFDLNPSCGHLTWSGGDVEDYISPNNLGGIDRSIWKNKVEMDLIMLHEGAGSYAQVPSLVNQRAQNALTYSQENRIASELDEVGYTVASGHTRALENMLTQMANDDSFMERIPFPTPNP